MRARTPGAATPPSPANIQLMQLTTACWASRCLHVVAELGVADALGDPPQSTEALAKATGTQPQALYRVLSPAGLAWDLRMEKWNLESHRVIALPSLQSS
jgi:hypothetical protein